jgi:hypothetical protein
METINSATSIRVPWNKGKLVGQKAPFKLTMSYGTHTLRRTKATLISRRTKNLLCSCFSAIPSSRVLRHLKSLDKFAGKATFCYKLSRCSKGS